MPIQEINKQTKHIPDLGAVQELVRQKCNKFLAHTAVINQMTNLASISILNEANHISDLDQWVQNFLPQAIENYFIELRMYCFKHALSITSNPELAEDIAQDSIQALLLSKHNIQFIKAWLRKTTISKASQYARLEKKQSTLIKRIETETIAEEDPNELDEKALYQSLTLSDAKKLLSPKDYKTFQKLRKHSNLKSYAADAKVSYQTAREHSLIVRTNLRAAYNRSKGWDDYPDILDYRKLISIKHFLQRMVDVFGTRKESSMEKNCIIIDKNSLYEIFEGVEKVEDWGVTDLGKDHFYLTLCDAGPDKFIFLKLKIRFSKAHRISLLECKRIPVGMIYKVPDELTDTIHKMIKTRTLPTDTEEFNKFVRESGFELKGAMSIRELNED